jgi:hypothetical protein
LSVYFRVGSQEIWNPASRAGMLFYEQLKALEKLVDLPCGITDLGCDEYEVAPVVFTEFVAAVVNALGRTNHAVLVALTENVLAVALGLEARIMGVWRTVPEGLSGLNPMNEPNVRVGPIQVSSQGGIDDFRTGAERLRPILERATVLERTFAGGEPAPRH